MDPENAAPVRRRPSLVSRFSGRHAMQTACLLIAIILLTTLVKFISTGYQFDKLVSTALDVAVAQALPMTSQNGTALLR